MILGCMIFYNDGAEMIARALKSLKAVTDRVIAIDGAYVEFPHKDFRSDKDTLDAAKAIADDVIEAREPWKDETAKRNAYLRLKNERDYYLMLDADEVIEGEKPRPLVHPVYRILLSTQKDTMWLPAYYNRLFRHHRGMRYHLKHNNLITRDGLSLSIPADNIPIFDGLKIKHYPDERPRVRQEHDGTFENTKEERNVELPIDQKTPMSDLKDTPVKLRYNGDKPYHGFDSTPEMTSTAVMCNPGDLVYLSKVKSEQLLKDFPTDWVFIKEL